MTDELDQKVQNILQEMADKYKAIEAAIEAMPPDPGTWSKAQFEQVNQHRQQIASFDTSNQAILESYRTSRPKGSEKAKQLRDIATEVLMRLINKMEHLEHLARSARDKLAPEINQKVRATQMLNAYGSD